MFLALGNLHSPSVPPFFTKTVSCKTNLLDPCSIAGTILKTGSEKENEIDKASYLELIL